MKKADKKIFKLLPMGKNKFLYLILFLATLISCGGQKKETDSEEALTKAIEAEIDSNATQLIKFNNVIFSLPSPYQFAFFIKDLGISYNKQYLNSTANIKSYTSTFKKALNMGIYGTDLGYLNIYEQVPDAIQYFSVLKSLSQDIGIANTFDASTIQRIEKNMGNQDSLLFIISNKYREADAYLKDNDRNSIAVLIVAGGWIESLHILCKVAKDKPSPMIAQKIAEQKHPLDNLIKILSPYYNHSEDYMKVIDQLIELAYDFDGVEYKYQYIEPETKPEEKLTVVKSKASLTINADQLKSISEKTDKLRNSIVK